MSDPFITTSPPHESSSAVAPATSGERRAHKDQPRIRRRNRLITSCLECRRRKLKCDKQQPCTNCTKFSRPCVFIAPGLDPEAQAKLAEVKEKMGMLERTLEDDVARKGTSKSSSKSPSYDYEAPALPGQDLGHSDQEEEEDAKGLDPTGLATEDVTYYDDEGNDDIVDLGISLGKLRITERIGGLVRPRISEELTQALKEVPEGEMQNPFAGQSPESWMSPSNDYVAPSSSFFFAPGLEQTSLMTYLPAKVLVDKLIGHYWHAVHLVARTVHRPSFERQYDIFWNSVASGIEPRISFQAVLFAALLSSAISMSEAKVLTDFGVDKHKLVESFKLGAESALARANFLRTTKLETLQAFVMYLIPLCRAEVSRAHSALTGTCIRLAECMGLHRDPMAYATNPIEIQVRRLIWFQICFLDLRTCESTGPRPQIRRDEYDTRFPLNIDDVDLERALERGTVAEDSKHFTDMTVARMRFECYEMHRFIWTERPKLQRKPESGEKKTTLTSLLSRIQAFGAAMEKTYLPMLDKTKPQHVLAMEIYGILSSRMYVMVLHTFASNDKRQMPERLRQIMMSACIMVVEHGMTLDQQPALAPWSWYTGALHQHHTSLLMLSEMYATNRDPALSERIWKCIDYTFDLPPRIHPREKVRMVLTELAQRTSTYATMRRMRIPTDMPRVGPRELVKPKSAGPSQHLEVENLQERERSSSIMSGYTSSSSPFSQHSQLPDHTQQQQNQYNPPFLPLEAPSYPVPQVDWGTFDPSAASGPMPPLAPTTTGTYNFGGFAPTAQGADVLAAMGVGSSSDASSAPAAVGAGGSSGSATDASPMEAVINDIDWNEWEQLFGSAQTGAGNILIPPFTFPSFEPSEIQWPGQDGGGAM